MTLVENEESFQLEFAESWGVNLRINQGFCGSPLGQLFRAAEAPKKNFSVEDGALFLLKIAPSPSQFLRHGLSKATGHPLRCFSEET